jgi:hypothetical protein
MKYREVFVLKASIFTIHADRIFAPRFFSNVHWLVVKLGQLYSSDPIIYQQSNNQKVGNPALVREL